MKNLCPFNSQLLIVRAIHGLSLLTFFKREDIFQTKALRMTGQGKTYKNFGTLTRYDDKKANLKKF